ncbi:MAG: hypothetical protein A3J24_05515 [Deltaproteobacteria bacterium RIFCSPLOWO2_02_FULL_53_8]|nr:MAG: hypothetical protein A3J24_05515 [Deltaproteobacteria bacterium RIFCSPLOWO2_02_FULL_53_8]
MGTVTQGFVTPSQDCIPQVHCIPPRRVLPIVFLPGIMGSNLRMSAARQEELGKKNNVAWRPDDLLPSLRSSDDSPLERQQRLDFFETVVDNYDPIGNPTGDPAENSDERNSNVGVTFSYPRNMDDAGPWLRDDPLGSLNAKTRDQKARERGWGEVYFGSYRELLEMCELQLNTAYRDGEMGWWWRRIVGVEPSAWQASAKPSQMPLDEKTLRNTVIGCWFPVHAMGYNWLQPNMDSGNHIAKRIVALLKKYQRSGFECEKVILVTHSMGGLVARAVIHPKMGNIGDKVLGIVHGVMPATGAGAAYKRMRCGFEDSTGNPIPKILGNLGEDVTAVLGNSQGGLELLPSQAYGDHWLRVEHKKKVLISLPKKGDPYEEIYKVSGKWYSLLREDWINPADQDMAGFARTCIFLDKAKAFHNAIERTYHEQSYAHYGADHAHRTWHHVVWELEEHATVPDAESLNIASDDGQGNLQVVDRIHQTRQAVAAHKFSARMMPAGDPGDQTVPLHSAEDQLRSGKFKGIFRQTGYEHQNSYNNQLALRSTLYSLIRIANTMDWSK